MEYAREDIRTLVRDGEELFAANVRETSDNPDVPVSINIDRYLQYENLGRAVVYTSRTDGKLVGYSIFMLNENLHQKEIIYAYQDVIYIDPDHRGHGPAFLDYTLDQLKQLGIAQAYIPVKTKNAFGSLLQRKGFQKTEEIFMRRL